MNIYIVQKISKVFYVIIYFIEIVNEQFSFNYDKATWWNFHLGLSNKVKITSEYAKQNEFVINLIVNLYYR